MASLRRALEADEPLLEHSLKGHKGAVNGAAFCEDEKKVVTCGDDHCLILWNLEACSANTRRIGGGTGLVPEFCYRLKGHLDSVNSVDMDRNGQFVVSASRDCSVRLWKIESKRPTSESQLFRSHTHNIRYVHLNSDSSRFCTSSDDKLVKVWDISRPNRVIATLVGHTNWVTCGKYSYYSSHLIASCGDDSLIHVHDTRTPSARSGPSQTLKSVRRPSNRSSSGITSIEWYPVCDFLLASSSSDGSVRVWDLRQSRSIQYYQAHSASVTSISFHPSGNYLISSSADESSKIYDLLEGRVLFTIKAHQGSVKSAKFSPAGERFATTGADKLVLLWESNLRDREEQVAAGGVEREGESEEGEETRRQQPVPSSNDDNISFHETLPKESLGLNELRETNQRKRVNESGDVPDDSQDPQQKLLENIVGQLIKLTATVSLIEQRVSKLEVKLDSRQRESDQ